MFFKKKRKEKMKDGKENQSLNVAQTEKMFKTAEDYTKEEMAIFSQINDLEKLGVKKSTLIIDTHDVKFNSISISGDFIDQNYIALQLHIMKPTMKYSEILKIVTELFKAVVVSLQSGNVFSFENGLVLDTDLYEYKGKKVRFPKVSEIIDEDKKTDTFSSFFVNISSEKESIIYDYVVDKLPSVIKDMSLAGYRIKIFNLLILRGSSKYLIIASSKFATDKMPTSEMIDVNKVDKDIENIKDFKKKTSNKLKIIDKEVAAPKPVVKTKEEPKKTEEVKAVEEVKVVEQPKKEKAKPSKPVVKEVVVPAVKEVKPKKPAKKKEEFVKLLKTELVDDVAKRVEKVSKKDVDSFIKAFSESITEELLKDNSVTVKGMGNFSVVDVKERVGVNPKTGEKIVIPSSRKVSLKWSSKVREYINK